MKLRLRLQLQNEAYLDRMMKFVPGRKAAAVQQGLLGLLGLLGGWADGWVGWIV